MATLAAMWRQLLARFGEARLGETKDGMAIERAFMTGQAIVITHTPQAEIGGGLAQAE
jgi:hypothetical protein